MLKLGVARLFAATLLAVSGMFWLPAAAQEAVIEDDPPDRAVRLGYREGEVSLQANESSEWETATLNRPLTTGDRLWADAGSRAELQIGSAMVHLDEFTGVELTDLRDESLELTLREGALNVHVRDVGRGETITIDTPNAIVVLAEPGEYRIEANEGGDTSIVKVREGAATVTSVENGFGTYRVQANQQGIFTGVGGLTAAIDAAGPRSAFDDWSRDREARGSRVAAAQYVSREIIGYEDLDDHGDWRSEPEYGYVWYPRTVVSGWAPYRYGHWAWVRPWGWTWVDHAPWGFAPFHYGRWAYVHNRWGWVPGPRHIRPVYAPALVAWVGSPSLSVSMSFGSGIGWFPLGPREVYVPAYRASRRHVTRVNVANTVIVNNTYITNVYENRGRNVRYAYQGRGNAVTAVAREDFTRGRPVDRHRIRWNEGDRGTIEANTVIPERTHGRTVARTYRPSSAQRPGASQSRPENFRSPPRRDDAVAEARSSRERWRSERPPSAQRRDGTVSRGFTTAPDQSAANTPRIPREIVRPRENRPPVAADQRTGQRTGSGIRNQVRNESRNEAAASGHRLRTAPATDNRSSWNERRAPAQREERSVRQNDARERGTPGRIERNREAERPRSMSSREPSSFRSGSSGSSNERSRSVERERRTGNAAGNGGRRDFSPQGQKQPRGHSGGRAERR